MKVASYSLKMTLASVCLATAGTALSGTSVVFAQEPAAQTAAAATTAAKAPSPKSLANWRGKVLTHLNSHKRAFSAADGTATVAFKIDRAGKVMTAKVVTSSGNKALDAEAVALTQRASPVPAPPKDVVGEAVYLKVPIRFTR